VTVGLKFPCIGFELNLVIPTYISTFLFGALDRSLALRDKLQFIPLKVSLFHDKCVPATTEGHVWPPTKKVVANILYKRSWTAVNGLFPQLRDWANF